MNNNYFYLEQIYKGILKKKLNSEQICKYYANRIFHSQKLKVVDNFNFNNLFKSSKRFNKKRKIKKKLNGIPISFKECFYKKNTLVNHNSYSSSFKKRFNNKSSKIISNFEKNGGIYLANIKTNQFLTGSINSKDDPVNPITRKPDLTGSCAGCAVAVSANLSPAVVASDFGGSIREPSAALGLIGYKTSRNLLSNKNSFFISKTLSSNGIISKNVTDCALLLENIQDPVLKKENFYQKLKFNKNFKIGFFNNTNKFDTNFDRFLITLENISKEINLKIFEINLENINEYFEIFNLMLNRDFYNDALPLIVNKNNFNDKKFYSDVLQKNLKNDVKRRLILGKFVVDNLKQFKIDTRINDFLNKKNFEFNSYFENYDALIYPVNLQQGKNITTYKKIKIIANLLGLPSIVIPISVNKKKKFDAIEIITGQNKDQLLLNIAFTLEKVLNLKFKLNEWWI